MAESAWIAARRRARELLLRTLDEEQRQDLAERGGFRIRKMGRLYWLRVGGAPVCADTTYGRLLKFCVAPDRIDGMPPEDITLTFLLWLTNDASAFARNATVVSSTLLPRRARASEPELIDLLALQASTKLPSTHPAVQRASAERRSTRSRTARQRVPPVPTDPSMSEEERVRALRCAHEIVIQLRVRHLKEILAGCPDLKDEVLERIAEEWRSSRARQTAAPRRARAAPRGGQ